MQAWDRASVVLEEFRRDYPDSEFADDVTQKLAVTYLGSGMADQAAAEFERIANAASSTDDVASGSAVESSRAVRAERH